MFSAPVVLWLLSALVCQGRSDHHIRGVQEDQESTADNEDNNLSLVASANKEFAFRFYRKLADHASSEGKNIFFSPASISAALAALSLGARGETHRQIFSGLGFNSSQLAQTDVDHAFRRLLANATSHEDICQGSAVFVDDLFKTNPEFLDALKQSYSAEGFSVDFAKAETADTINQYVSDKTKGKINKLVESLDPNTVMYFLSYIYYKGKWKTPFKQEKTSEDVFRVEENQEVKVQMMKIEEENVDTYHDKAINTTVLHLPFNNSYSMLLLLPENMTTLENTISPAHVTKWLKWMKTRTYNIYVPKFSIKTSYKLNDMLTGMGMTDMFGNRADLSGIAEGQKLSVSEVVHQASLDVDEGGATAAAATGIQITLLSYRFIPELKFDRPFMVIVTERTAENMLFIGKITNPNI